MSRRILRSLRAPLALAGALGLLVGACHRLPPPAQQRPEAAPIPLIVQNNHPLDVVIYAVRPGPSVRVGTVMTCLTDTLMIPYSLAALGALRLAIDPIGSTQRQPIGPIIVLPGDRIELIVEAYLPATSWRLLPRVIANARQ